MEKVSIIGVDIAKHVFQVHGARADGSMAFSKKLSRGKLLLFLAAQPRCVVAMEACASSHHWGRTIEATGHQVRLIAPAYVKPFVKRQKNDAADAEAIAEAASRPTMRFVAVKSAEKQASGGEWLDVVELCGGHQRGDNRPACRAAIGAGEQMVFAAEGDRPDGAFDGVIVELDATVIKESAKSFPSGQRVTDGVGESAFWRDSIELCFEPGLYGLDQRQRLDPPCHLSCLGRLASDGRLDRIEFGDAPERFCRDR